MRGCISVPVVASSAREPKTYRTGDRGGSMIVGFAFMGGGGLFVVLGLLGGLGLFGESNAIGVVTLVAIGLLVFWVGATKAIDLPYEVRVRPDGTVEFVKVLGRKTVRAHDIQVVERTLRKISADEDGDPRQIRIRHTRGTLSISYFDELEQFIAHVQAINPGVALEGQW